MDTSCAVRGAGQHDVAAPRGPIGNDPAGGGPRDTDSLPGEDQLSRKKGRLYYRTIWDTTLPLSVDTCRVPMLIKESSSRYFGFTLVVIKYNGMNLLSVIYMCQIRKNSPWGFRMKGTIGEGHRSR